MKELFNGSVYNFGSVSSIWVTINYEKKRNGADMQYRFNYKIRLSNRSGGAASSAFYQNNLQGKFYLNNINVYAKSVKNSKENWSFEYTTEWFNVEDKTTGTVPFKFTIKDTQNSSWCNYSSATFQLEISPAGSDFKTLSNFNIGQPFTITTNKYNEDFYDKLVIKIGTTTIKTINNTGTSIQVDFTSAELSTIYDLTKTVQYTDFTFELSSYEDSSYTTQVGVTNSKVVKGYIIASNPIISSKSAVDTNNTTIALTGNNTKLIRAYSNVKVTVNATGQNQATIKSVTINGITATLINGAYVVNFNKTIVNTFNIVVTDSRDFPTTASITLDMINYIELTISPTVVRNQPTDGKAKISYSGNYFNGSFGSVSNTLTIQYRFKEKGQTFTDSDAWINLTPTITNNTYKQADFIVEGVDYQKVYEFQIRAVDKLNTQLKPGIVLPEGKPIAWWNKNEFYVKDEGISSFIANIRDRIEGYGEPCKTVYGDWNTACGETSGFFMGGDLANSPDLSISGWYLVAHLVCNSIYKSQVAFGFQKHCVYIRNQTNGTWNEWKKISYENDKLVEVVESGVVNGATYTKYSDGRMICEAVIDSSVTGGHQTAKDGWYVSARVVVNFPQTFIETPNVYPIAERTSTDTTGAQMFVGNVTTSSFATWSGLMVKSTATGFKRRYVAIGKWK